LISQLENLERDLLRKFEKLICCSKRQRVHSREAKIVPEGQRSDQRGCHRGSGSHAEAAMDCVEAKGPAWVMQRIKELT